MRHKKKFNNYKPQDQFIEPEYLNSILYVSNINGDFKKLDELINLHEAKAVFHSGNFGFLDKESLSHLHPRLLSNLIKNSSLLTPTRRSLLLSYPTELLKMELKVQDLSEFSQYIYGKKKFPVPIYTIHGSADDVEVLKKLESYSIVNLHFVYPGLTPVIKFKSTSVKLFGLGGAYIQSKLFDHGFGSSSMAGGSEGSWVTLFQLGNLVESGQEHKDAEEIRVFLSYDNPSKEIQLRQLAFNLKADFTLSPNSSISHNTSYCLDSIYPSFNVYRDCMVEYNEKFRKLYDSVWPHFQKYLDPPHSRVLSFAENVFKDPPHTQSADHSFNSFFEDSQFHGLVNINYGHGIINFKDSVPVIKLISDGVNFSHRASIRDIDNAKKSHENSWIQFNKSDQAPDEVTKALSHGEFITPEVYFNHQERNDESPISSRASSTDIPNEPLPLLYNSKKIRPTNNSQTIHNSFREDSPVSASSDDTHLSALINDNSENVSINPPTCEVLVDSKQEFENNPLQQTDLVYDRDSFQSPETSKSNSSKLNEYSKENDSSKNDHSGYESDEIDLPNEWGIKFFQIPPGNARPSSWISAKENLIFVLPKHYFDPARDVNELFYDLQDQIVRIFLLQGRSFINVEIKDPHKVDEFIQNLDGRTFKDGGVISNRKWDKSVHQNNRNNRNNYSRSREGIGYRNNTNGSYQRKENGYRNQNRRGHSRVNRSEYSNSRTN